MSAAPQFRGGGGLGFRGWLGVGVWGHGKGCALGAGGGAAGSLLAA